MTARPTAALWWFEVGGNKFNHLDLTGREVLALEARLGCEWGDVRPGGSVGHKIAILETFLARSDPELAKERVEAMTMAELDEAVTFEGRDDDLPVDFEDGLPKAGGAT